MYDYDQFDEHIQVYMYMHIYKYIYEYLLHSYVQSSFLFFWLSVTVSQQLYKNPLYLDRSWLDSIASRDLFCFVFVFVFK